MKQQKKISIKIPFLLLLTMTILFCVGVTGWLRFTGFLQNYPLIDNLLLPNFLKWYLPLSGVLIGLISFFCLLLLLFKHKKASLMAKLGSVVCLVLIWIERFLIWEKSFNQRNLWFALSASTFWLIILIVTFTNQKVKRYLYRKETGISMVESFYGEDDE